MARILTGIQSSGIAHLGNLLGAILPAVEMANDPNNDSFLFIADLHALTSIHDGPTLRNFAYDTAIAWLACGLDTEKSVFYRQSDVPETAELTWYLSCFMPYSRLKLAHSFKDKSENMKEVNGGIFLYPVLMAADILLYDANIVPVGKDQKQHLEFTRKIAGAVNRTYGDDTLVVPEVKLDEKVMVIPGIDGRKMSKSYDNTIVIFDPDKKLKKQIMRIETDATPLEAPKNPDTCNVFRLYELLASEEQVKEMRKNYLAGGYGYGHAKTALFELVVKKFAKEREAWNYYQENLGEVDRKLNLGAEKARTVARPVLERVRERMGFQKLAKSIYK